MRIRMCFDDVAWERSEAIQDAWIHELFKEETLMAIAYDDLVPFVLHWGTKEESPLGLGPLIIMEYIDHVMDLSDVLNTPGVAIKDCPILDPNIDEAKLELLYGQFADILLQLSTLRLPRIGSLAQIDDFTWEGLSRARGCQRRTKLFNQRHPTPICWQIFTSSISHTNGTMPSIDLGQEDKEWKILLQKHTPDYSDAREFWLDFYSLSKYPNLDERGMDLLKDQDSKNFA
ncbi:hypothetical protein KXV27_003297 [Aspergillus fumigatus]|nr:hypothetical protein CNMCM8714_002037 [Aspergillus fumigatus]KAH1629734.1 hypothetical protein KXX39_003438 [Aspergillus fumigatus]KAH1912728.1 hypothetical protein KXW69_008082 [Aspergillus fumigatus]KAH1929224.1 hypothetical protein KXV48_002661 [Aspergillus fumigatus]KAH2328552.1 hypothetical protein KXW87_003831 [Aspergillus fumigatus]